MDVHLLRVLAELHRRGTMRAVAEATGYSTSTVSLQLATLERQMGARLLERTGRTVRLTPAGRRLVERAEGILAAVEAAHAEIGPRGRVSGTLRLAAAASALSQDLIPVAAELGRTHPELRLRLEEREPAEIAGLLDADAVDVGFVYDYNVVPRFAADGDTTRYICATPLRLALPAADRPPAGPEVLPALRDRPWVVNSRGVEDTELVERFCAQAGYAPVVAHRADSLALVLEFVAAGLGAALVPRFVPARPGVVLIEPPGMELRRRMFAVTRPGRYAWPAVRLVVDRVETHSAVG